MGVAPSLQQHKQLYTLVYEGGKKELALVPLTDQFFPSADCPAFQRIVESRLEERVRYMYCRNSGLRSETLGGSAKTAKEIYDVLIGPSVIRNTVVASDGDVRELAERYPNACRPLSCAVALVWDDESHFDRDVNRKAKLVRHNGRLLEYVGYFGVRNTKPVSDPLSRSIPHTFGMYLAKSAGDHLSNYVMILAARAYLEQSRAILGCDDMIYFPRVDFTTLRNNVPVHKAALAFAATFAAAAFVETPATAVESVVDLEDDDINVVDEAEHDPPRFSFTISPRCIRRGVAALADRIRPKPDATTAEWVVFEVDPTHTKPTQFRKIVRCAEDETRQQGLSGDRAYFRASFSPAEPGNSALYRFVSFSRPVAQWVDYVNELCTALEKVRAMSPDELRRCLRPVIDIGGEPTNLFVVTVETDSKNVFDLTLSDSVLKRSGKKSGENKGHSAPSTSSDERPPIPPFQPSGAAMTHNPYARGYVPHPEYDGFHQRVPYQPTPTALWALMDEVAAAPPTQPPPTPAQQPSRNVSRTMSRGGRSQASQ